MMDAMPLTLLFAVFWLLFALEALFPGQRQRFDWRWFWRAGAINLAQLAMVLLAEHSFNRWLATHALLRLPDGWPAWAGGLLAFFIASFLLYWWHRAEHASALLWRVFHQLHHSPARIQVLSANYAHPLDFLATTFFNSVAALFVLGLGPQGAAWCVLLSGAVNYFVHTNLRTPYWLGYLIQRPEMHRVHHQFGHHADNYGLPLWDALFGTWRNPRQRVEVCGFEPERERRWLAMLCGRDVHRG